MFLFLSLSAVHSPLQVPEEYVKQYEGKIEDEKRRIYAGMTSCMDEGIKNLTNTLQRYNLWKNTVLIFSSGMTFKILTYYLALFLAITWIHFVHAFYYKRDIVKWIILGTVNTQSDWTVTGQ